ncbi:hypothetical protein [Streptomyces lunaelactis]|uniref:hypothetical protein n=1 Tax=Streptomyces lunaelactis TaxID=1535768 RepID=UPI00131F0162|nr:hypothetical protein [Streptomyces lunaelactis]NUK84742.1 hypothetical protein [Streptomyces lunaelactis]NUL02400.1 hypothetical protein [Streptomyces lunaelactis]
MFKSLVCRARTSKRSVLYAVTGLVTVALLVAAVVAGNVVWNGAQYPSADPDAVAQRLKARSDEVYDSFALSEKYAAGSGRVDTGACYYRGLRSIAHIDEARSDVRSFGLDWSVPDVPEAAARDAQRRVRQRLVQKGWKLTHEGDRAGATFRELGFRFENPGGDQVDVRWNDSTTTLFISVYAPCGQVPDEFVEYDWSEADWHPQEQSAGP